MLENCSPKNRFFYYMDCSTIIYKKFFPLPLILLMAVFFSNLTYAQLPDDFYDQLVVGGFDFPTGIVFDDNGQGYVWEKKGVVHVIDTSGQKLPTPLLDISEEVSNWKDHGLLGVCLAPDFLNTGHFYLLYVVDLHHYFNYGTTEYHPDTTTTFEATFGRVARYTADPASNFRSVVPESRKLLLGESIENGIPILYEFHGLGSIITGLDGTLLISSGDGTSNHGSDIGGDSLGSYITDALEKGILTPDQDVGSYKSQYQGNLNGKILRIDPDTGDGLPSNPFFDPANPRSPPSRLWANGFRNPYRIALQPDSGSHFPEDGEPGVIMVGDVGNGAWEELDVVTEGGQNFGWPIYEGFDLMWAFHLNEAPANQLAINPLFGQGSCDQQYFDFRELLAIAQPERSNIIPNPCNGNLPIPESAFPAMETLPVLTWSNARWNTPTRAMEVYFDEDGIKRTREVVDPQSSIDSENFDGYSSLAGIFYSGDSYPEEYHNKYFAVDFSGWIKIFDFDNDYHLQSTKAFHDNATDIIHLALNPVNGQLYYINLAGEVRTISYGGNPPPTATINADQFFGPGPLSVQFDASGSSDINGNIVAYEWDFGDGTTANGAIVEHTFSTTSSAPTSFNVTLTVEDDMGARGQEQRIVSLNNTPPEVHISSVEDGALYPLWTTTLLELKAEVNDKEHAQEELIYEWRTYLHHNDHYHPDPVVYEQESFIHVAPLGCEQEDYWYRIELTVTDPVGLASTDRRLIYPNCGDPFVQIASLEGTATDNAITLNWTTDLEENIQSFEIQRTTDFFNFESLGIINSKGPSNYTFIDEQPIKGANIYRVKIIQEGGAYDYTNLATISFPPATNISVFPNPAYRQFKVAAQEAQAGTIRLELFSPNGVRILQTDWESQPGDPFEQVVLTSGLSKGLYLYKVTNGAITKVGKISLF